MRLIDADGLIKHIENYKETIFSSQASRIIHEAKIEFAIDEILDAPTIKIEPVRHGYWIDKGTYELCSACQQALRKEIEAYYKNAIPRHMNYCPFCGAKMKEKDKNE